MTTFTLPFPAAMIATLAGLVGPEAESSVPRYALPTPSTNPRLGATIAIGRVVVDFQTDHSLGERVPSFLDKLFRRRLVRRRAADPDLRLPAVGRDRQVHARAVLRDDA